MLNSYDLAKRVEVTIPPTLRSSGRRVYSVAVRIKNISEKTLVGPVRLVIEGTSVSGFSVQAAEGTDDASQPFIELLAAGRKLAPDASTRSRRVVFRSKQTVSLRGRKNFEVQYHVTRGGLAYADREHSDKLPAFVGGGRRGKAGRRAQAGNGKVDQAVVQRVIKIQDRWTDRLMKVKGVVGTSTALDKQGRIVVRIYALHDDEKKQLPRTVDGVRTEIVLTWPLRPLYQTRPPHPPKKKGGGHGGGGGGPMPPMPPAPPAPPAPPTCAALAACDRTAGLTSRYNRPIPVGAQISNISQGSNCGVGTFGAVVTDGTRTFLLSNNHVIGRRNDAQVGERIVQPGCGTSTADTVATFFKLVPIVFTTSANNRVDAGIALSTDAQIDRQTACAAYGGVRAAVQVKLGDKVQKIGRTTGRTYGTVTAINATVTINYGGGKGPARFTGQIGIGQPGFGGPGDSGSLVVLDPSREAVALLFGGSPSITLCNPILEVETALGVKIKCAP